MTQTNRIIEEFKILQENYEKPVDILEGLPFSQAEVIKKAEFYGNSKYLTSQKDENNRRKPFHQVLNGMCDVENAAVDLDTKDIVAVSDDRDAFVVSTLITKDIYKWMNEVNFAKTLNEMKETRTRYGGLLVKKVIKKDDLGKRNLFIEVPEWKNIITDQVDILKNPIVEVHYMTVMDLQKKRNVWKASVIDDICASARKSARGKRIAIYEMRGEFPRAYYREAMNEKPSKNDTTEFSYQLFILAGAPEGEKTGDLKVIYAEDDTEHVYKYLPRKKKAGRALGVGIFEEGEEAQISINEAVQAQSRAMLYSTKVVGQTASKKLKGRNLNSEVTDGDILVVEENKPIVPLNLLPSGGLGQYQNVIAQWYQQLERATSAYGAQRGEAPPSGTPFRTQALILNQSSSVFDDLLESFGIFVGEIMNEWVLPFLATQLNKEHVLAWEFTPEELSWIDRNYAERYANQRVAEAILSRATPTDNDVEAYKEEAKRFIGQTGAKRFITLLKNDYKNAKSYVTFNITGEQRNKAAILESLLNIMNIYASNPTLSTDPVLTKIFLKLVELSGAGISGVSLLSAFEEAKKKPAQQPTVPAQQTPLSLEANPTQDVEGLLAQ